MEQWAFSLTGTTKQYPGFTFGPVDLALPRGTVMGLVGANGAGKTTLIRLLLGLTRSDSGETILLDSSPENAETHEKVGVVFDECPYPELFTPTQIGNILAGMYGLWQPERFEALLGRMNLPVNKPVKDFSRGMKMKLSIAAALSHGAELLLLDEPTGGLDPLVREEILDLFREFMLDESHSILLSSHITSDLEKISDQVAFLHKGRLLLTAEKDQLLEEYGILKGRRQQLEGLDEHLLTGLRTGSFGFEALVKDRRGFQQAYPELTVDAPTLEDVMAFVVREADQP